VLRGVDLVTSPAKLEIARLTRENQKLSDV
jgi:hypothetical protein